jgi:hypothetical protein
VCAIAKNGLTLRGIGGRARIDAAQKNYGGKAIWVISGNDTTVENIEFSGATVPDQNGAGIRQEGSNLTVRGCYFHDNEDGILTGSGANSQIVIEFSEFANNGFGDGFSHNMYIGNVGRFTLRYSYSHDSKIGHLVKLRGGELHSLQSCDRRSGDVELRGRLAERRDFLLIGNSDRAGTGAPTTDVVASRRGGVCVGYRRQPGHALPFVINNTFVNDRTGGDVREHGVRITTPATIKNNVLRAPAPSPTRLPRSWLRTSRWATRMLGNAATYDYHLCLAPVRRCRSDPAWAKGSLSHRRRSTFIHRAKRAGSTSASSTSERTSLAAARTGVGGDHPRRGGSAACPRVRRRRLGVGLATERDADADSSGVRRPSRAWFAPLAALCLRRRRRSEYSFRHAAPGESRGPYSTLPRNGISTPDPRGVDTRGASSPST